jgi:hypothetical protein
LLDFTHDVMKGSAMIQDALERPGPAPRLTDSELVTIAICNYSGALEWLVGPDKGDGSEPFHQKWRGLPKGTDRPIGALDALG